MNRIVCVGNQFIEGDELGSRVYARFENLDLPDSIQVIDGGVAGLNLLSFFDGCERLVFVDNIGADVSPDEVVVLEGADLITEEMNYSHASGLGYVLQADRAIRASDSPRVFLVGANQSSDEIVSVVIERCMQIVSSLNLSTIGVVESIK